MSTPVVQPVTGAAPQFGDVTPDSSEHWVTATQFLIGKEDGTVKDIPDGVDFSKYRSQFSNKEFEALVYNGSIVPAAPATVEVSEENKALAQQNEKLESENEKLESENTDLEKQNQELADRVAKINSELEALKKIQAQKSS